MKCAARVLVALMLWTAGGHAAELTPIVTNRMIGARLAGLSFPDSLNKDLRSGLTNRVLIRVMLNEQDKLHGTRSIEVAIKYDLWDETFSVVQRRDEAVVNEQVLKAQSEVLAYLRDLNLPDLFPAIANAGPLTLRADVLLNPIQRERMEQIQKWVRENSSHVPLEGAAESTSNTMFNRIFEQYARGSDGAAEWRESTASEVFSVKVP
jgi:hypothetical protein